MKRNRSFVSLVFGIVLAFVAGLAFNVMTAPGAIADDDEVKELRAKVEQLEKRLDGIKLKFGEQVAGPDWGCGSEDTKDMPYVMVGAKDGTGCGVANRNYYRRIEIEVPR